MIYSYFQSLNWQLMQSKIWDELIRACALSMDAALPDIGTVRDLYLPWVSPEDYAGSRGIFKLPNETTADYRKRIVAAYAFWEKIHSPALVETLLDGDVTEYSDDIWAEFSFRFNQAIAQEEVETFLHFLNEIKPARSRLKGVVLVSDFLVTKDHRHTGGDDGAQVSHSSLLDGGLYTHDEIDDKIDTLSVWQNLSYIATDRTEIGPGYHTFAVKRPSIVDGYVYKIECIVRYSEIENDTSVEVGMALFGLELDGDIIMFTPSMHYERDLLTGNTGDIFYKKITFVLGYYKLNTIDSLYLRTYNRVKILYREININAYRELEQPATIPDLPESVPFYL